ncbi:hypothetical protein PaG_06601 [Moesziomyces aphidis]|uniref:Zn(2)-C6 fungal-type domain-containing protein n=1 Tax=Moesziomyces aphidis TaxID=84754 RepID=W3VDP5_MOEAP|nr:hypothetical protein PaG_06601 [Moesziomyces aphidis]
MPDQDVRGDGAEGVPATAGYGPPRREEHMEPSNHSADDGLVVASSSAPSDARDAARDEHSDTTSTHPRSNRMRPSDTLRRSQACLACRKRKLRCDARKPTCTRCEKAWLAYYDTNRVNDPSQLIPPPCEYDTSLLAKIFQGNTPADGAQGASSSSSHSRARDSTYPEQSENSAQLQQENEQLRSQITRLERRLTQVEATPDTDATRSEGRYASSAGNAAARVSVQELTSRGKSAEPTHKRARYPDDTFPSGGRLVSSRSVLPPIHSSRLGDNVLLRERQNAPSYGEALPSRNIETRPHRASSTSSSASRPALGWQAPPHYLDNIPASSPTQASAAQPMVPPLPDRQSLHRLIEMCEREAWLFGAINTFALSDVMILLETAPANDTDTHTATAVMLALVATALPLLAPACPAGIRSSTIFTSIDARLRKSGKLDGVSMNDTMEWISTVCKFYADAARYLLSQVQGNSESQTLIASLVVRVLLVECSLGHSAMRTAQADLAQAASEARLLHLHNAASTDLPRLGEAPSRPSHLGRALRGLATGSEQGFAFWSLFLQDCFQNRLATLPVMLERQEIQTSFPGRTESHSPVSPPKRSEDVEAYMQRRRGLPAFHVLDTSMTLLVKLGLVLDQCCEYSNVARQSLQAQGGNMAGSEVLDQRFGAAHEAIRNSRLMLSQYDERMSRRTHAYDHSNPTDGKKDAMVASVMLRDPLRFAAEVTHHLAVLRAFEGAINLAAPPPPTGQARDMIRNAAIWLSRLADMALEQAPVLFGMPAFCSTAFFIGARWLLFLQSSQPNEFHQDIAAIVLALRERAASFKSDLVLARAIVALKKERDVYGRVCVSPFAWPVEAVSEFISIDSQSQPRARPQQVLPARKASYVSIASLAAAVEDAAVIQLTTGTNGH